MDTPARTAEYIARRDTRQATLKHTLTQLLATRLRLTLEIGAGHGHFLTDYAAAHPAEFCLGIDLIADRVARANRKCKRAGLTNLHFLQAEAEECVAVLPPAVALQRIFVLFPDPWPKRRHHKNRIMQPAFLSALAARAAPESFLFFRTDDTSYFAATREVLYAHADWRESAEAGPAWPFERETVFQSRAHAYQSLVAVRRIFSSQF